MDFNSIEYAWKDIEVVMLGRPLVRITEISYTTDIEKKHVYGRGNKALGVQVGNEKVTGSMSIGQSELEALIQKAQEVKLGAKPTDIAFDVNVTYRSGVDIVRDRIVGVSLTQVPKGMKQGDTEMEVKMPFIALEVKYSV